MSDAAVTCSYELRAEDRVVATGQLTLGALPQAGTTMRLGRTVVLVEEVLLGPTPRLVLSSG